MRHAFAQLRCGTPALLLAHEVQPLDTLLQRRGYLLLHRGHGIAAFGGIQRARYFKHCVQVGLGAHAKLFGNFAEGAQVAADQVAVHGKRDPAAALQAEGHFDVTTVQMLLQHAADLHFDGVHFRRKTQMQIEKAMVHRLQAEGEGELVVGIHLHLRVAGHGADVHSGAHSVPVAVSTSTNCKSYNRR